MSNTRPSFVHNKPNQLQLTVPPGWLTIVGGVHIYFSYTICYRCFTFICRQISRKPHTQVLRIQDPQQPDDDKYLTSLPKKIKDGMMIESDGSDSASFMPTKTPRTLNVEFYFRLIEVMERGSDLVDNCSKSASLDIIEVRLFP
jgi:hypothetical protein